MKSQRSFGIALAAILVLGAPSMAQVVSVVPSLPAIPMLFSQSFTTGMVGFTSNQTARLNVLNLNPVPAATATAPANCNVQLQFYSGSNTSLAQTVVMNFAPGTATSFDLPRTAVTSATAARVEIRGVVTVNPALPTPSSAATPGYCSVKTTLEIFDDTSGSTVVLTSDTSPTGIVTLAGILSGIATAQ